MNGVSYLRVSTGKQARSGLGLAAQRDVVERFAAQHGFTLVGEYVEVETGKGHDALERRPKLKAALAHARKLKAPVIVAKLCRLSRDVEFISHLMNRRLSFIVAELGPAVPSFMLHIYAAVAQQERELIAARTREALAAARKRGVKLGAHGKQLAAENKAQADAQATALRPLLQELRARGTVSVRAVMRALNERGIPAARGGKWSITSAARLLRRVR
jgi:DNA invertase Pin-like site-specific DNA recombinase